MDEKTIQKRLKKTIIFVAGIIIMLLMISGLLITFLKNTMTDAANTQMHYETVEYKNRLFKQIDADFQNLNTLSSFIESSHLTTAHALAPMLQKANTYNAFITMGYFEKNGTGAMAILDEAVRTGVDVSTLDEEVIEVIEKAWNGERSVSKLFESQAISERVFVYGVPICKGDTIVGALVASDHIDIFTDIISGNGVLGGDGYIHMLGSEGKILIRAQQDVIEEQMDTIFDGPYFNPNEVENVKNSLDQQETIFSSFQYQGVTYQFLLEPVGLNGWYLLCVSTTQESSRAVYRVIRVMGMTFAGILGLILFLLFYGYHMIQKSNRDLIYLAYHDQLTGADNLPRFRQNLANALEQGHSCSVAALNVHQFKFINEIFGSEQADRLLCYINQILKSRLLPGEYCCRDTADLFYLYLNETKQETIFTRLREVIEEITRLPGGGHGNYRVLLYCGVAVFSGHSQENYDANSLITHALFALASARGSYSNNIRFYDSQLHRQETQENYIVSHMHQALQSGEFGLYLQPKIDLSTDTLGGAEALVRWITEEGTMLFPDQFIPLFEGNGFCARLDLYMVERACCQIREWIDLGIKPVGISVNQSKLLFFERSYIPSLRALIAKYDIPANLITLEILEGLALKNIEELNAQIKVLQEIGFCVSMDDFGSGYSSLNTLAKLHIDELKLDRGFLLESSSGKSDRSRIIMEQIVQLSKRLGISTVIEGIETSEHDRLSKSLGCDFGQGYYYSRPVSAAEFNLKYMGYDAADPDTD